MCPISPSVVWCSCCGNFKSTNLTLFHTKKSRAINKIGIGRIRFLFAFLGLIPLWVIALISSFDYRKIPITTQTASFAQNLPICAKKLKASQALLHVDVNTTLFFDVKLILNKQHTVFCFTHIWLNRIMCFIGNERWQGSKRRLRKSRIRRSLSGQSKLQTHIYIFVVEMPPLSN